MEWKNRVGYEVNYVNTSSVVNNRNNLKAYIDAFVRLDAKWIVVHAGSHFTDDFEKRRATGRERLQRIVD